MSLDLGRLSGLLEVDSTSRAVRFAAGTFGPAAEAGVSVVILAIYLDRVTASLGGVKSTFLGTLRTKLRRRTATRLGAAHAPAADAPAAEAA